MSQFEDRYNLDWLPGFREMMVCQESDGENMDSTPQNTDFMPSNQNTMPEWMRTMPEEMETMPEEMETMPEWMRTMPEEVDSVPERMRAIPEEVGSVPEQREENRMLPPEELQQEEQMYWNDYEYMIRMLPAVAREIWTVADALLDKYEYEGSSMYAEYPDRNALMKIVDMVYDTLHYYECNQSENKVDGTEGKNCYYMNPEERGINTPLRHLIFVMICWNMAYRRQRYRRRKKIFPRS